ncbi:MAG TPA: ABC-F family ATP-binding cassette domain-containing protein [Acidiphilium sp.]|nr:MAG: elongation factor 3 [Acidiphilium sp. 21-60-14]OYV90957.1 MAG: elongation factor 3 [Acidiphilium sp. 37-60-79]OZB38919.1 MAG: elongation factor 3 [Acidiphilium sp. 34-60-192]HQT88625.1 ABC-F family ATP-binding cassette domain-containing protein [Acidiphilium sp.]HQU23968.1 ABC-F family ATP-binding cassette domain-containing protein [Acidiphilium sp.]
MAPPVLMLQDIRLSLGAAPLLDQATIGVAPGERICLVGRNGSGKSTLLRIAAGTINADSGTRFLQPGATLRYLPQEPDLTGFPTVLDYVLDGLDAETDGHRARGLIDQLGLTGAEDTSQLSGGEARRAAIARVLAPAPDILLLDEPTNHLDLPAIEWLEAELRQSRAGIVLISHDRRLLERVSRSIVWLDRGRTNRIDRGFAHFESWRDEVIEQEARDAQKLSREIVREEDWMRYGVTARRKRNVRRVAELAALRERKRTEQRAPATLKVNTSSAALSGKIVFDAERITKSFGEQVIIRDLTLRVLRGDRLGIVGPNGAGKSTLLKLLTGLQTPDEGKITIGTNLSIATLDQQRAALDPSKTLAETLTGGRSDQVEVGGTFRHVIGYMKDFLFRPEQSRTPVGVLSGGERGRLLLAAILAKPSNLLILDEPTNDLDLETLDVLQEMLSDYAGTILLVSHDRDFLDRIATSTLAAEGQGRWIEYAGGYSDMLAQRGSSAEAPAAQRKTAAAPRPAPNNTGFSFKDRHQLKTLETEIAALHTDIAAREAVLADPELFLKNPKKFASTTEKLSRQRTALATAEEQWLELELRREANAG